MKTLKAGDKVPNFQVKDHLGNEISFANYKGKKLIIFFYPKANTPGCTAEACDLRDNFEILKQKGYNLLGVSADNEEQQKKFAQDFNLPFPLLVDENKEIINIFGVWGTKKFMGKEYEGIHRVTFIIDENGLVKRVIDKVKTKEHTKQILEEN